ncbi:BMP family ABC transporter substrate-binding protein [Collinsella vaginalis]|uniref:BMP family lipoprotein n=1 Tax=Collinsella vaginalis TaxID=1870987 RepID=UPI000A267016
MKKTRFASLASVAAAGALALALAGCGSGGSSTTTSDGSASANGSSSYQVSMVTDMGGVNDQSFNQLTWEGLQELEKETGIKVGYTESKQESDYATNVDKAVDQGSNLVWGIGFAMDSAIQTAAKQNPDVNFAIIDNAYDESDLTDNLTGVTFRTQEPSFVVGYIAAMTSETGKVGFVGGMQNDIIGTFEWGYRAGVAYANKKAGKNVEVTTQYLETFTDAAKGKAAGQKLYSDGCDVVFQAAGNAGNGVIETAQDAGKYVIGVDKDQYSQAPDNILSSALKRVDKAVIEISKQASEGEDIGGKNVELGMSDDAAGISEHHEHMSDEVYQAAQDLIEQIKDGTLTPPSTEDAYNTFVAGL